MPRATNSLDINFLPQREKVSVSLVTMNITLNFRLPDIGSLRFEGNDTAITCEIAIVRGF